MRFIISFIFIVSFIHIVTTSEFKLRKERHVFDDLNSKQIQYISSLSDVQHINEVLNAILIPRVVDTPNHTMVQNYLVEQLNKYGFTVNYNEFKEKTPTHGVLTFKNVIGTLNPNAERFLVLACHYDSKYYNDIYFTAATDSAVPCAMMLNLIKTMQSELDAIKENDDLSLMLLFLDGEEAFKTWTKTDSIYGARNLARSWHGKRQNKNDISMLDRLDVFMLLDLLGTPQPKFYSYFRQTDRHYLVLSKAEDALAKYGLLQTHKHKYFEPSARNTYIEDDHIPFLERGVPILHIIPTPFPDVWHTERDNRNAIDMGTVENLNKIIRVFVASYLHLPIPNLSTSEERRNVFHEEF